MARPDTSPARRPCSKPAPPEKQRGRGGPARARGKQPARRGRRHRASPRRGGQERALAQAGLRGLVATRDGGIPLLSRAYPGNQVDVTQFQPMIEELHRRYTTALGGLGGPGGATVTFDAGQDSQPNFVRLAELGLHFVGSVPPSDHPGLLARPATDRQVVPAYADERLSAFETTAMVLGLQRRVILTHSPGLHTVLGRSAVRGRGASQVEVPVAESFSMARHVVGSQAAGLPVGGRLVPYRLVGRHRRIQFEDLMTYKQRTDVESRQAADDLIALSEELGLYE